MSEGNVRYVGSIFGVRGDRGETHLYLKTGSSETAVEIPGPGYGYKGFVRFGQTYLHDSFVNFLFRLREVPDTEQSLCGWDDVREIRIRDLNLDIFVDQSHEDAARALEHISRT